MPAALRFRLGFLRRPAAGFRPSRLAWPLLAAGLLAGCGSLSAPPQTFDLRAPDMVKPARPGRAQLVIAEPTALQALDSDRILVRSGDGQVSYLPAAQWSDRLPNLVQARLIQTFENADRIGSVGRPSDKLTPDATLVADIRDFEIQAGGAATAVVAISAKIVSESTGRIVAAQVFSASVPAGVTGPQASAALDQAMQTVLREIVTWASSRI